MAKTNFQEVSITAKKRWVDQDGKRRQATRKFYQTLNPFNRNSDGSVKNRSQILEEIDAERNAWLASGTSS